MPQPLAAGSVLGGRYRISDHVVTSADQDMVFHGSDQVLNRRVTILVASQGNAGQVASSARELATGERQEDIQVLDLGLSEGRTYLVAGGSPDADVLLGLAYEQELHVEPFETDTLGSEIFGASRTDEAHRYDDDETYYTDLDRRLRADDAQTRRRPGLVNRISEKLNEHVRPSDGTAAKASAAAAALAAADAASRAQEEERQRQEREAAERVEREAQQQAEREAQERAHAERVRREAEQAAEEQDRREAEARAGRGQDGKPPLRPLTEAPPTAAPDAPVRVPRPAPRRALNGPGPAARGTLGSTARPITWAPGEHRPAGAGATGADAAAGAAAGVAGAGVAGAAAAGAETPAPDAAAGPATAPVTVTTPAATAPSATATAASTAPAATGHEAAHAPTGPTAPTAPAKLTDPDGPPEPGAPTDASSSERRGSSPWLLGVLLTLLLLGAIALGFLLLSQNSRSVDPAPAATGPASPSVPAASATDASSADPSSEAPAGAESSNQQAPAAAPQPVGITRVVPDMPELEQENESALPNLIDGDPGTGWQSLVYARPNFGGYVANMDLVVELADAAPVSEVLVEQQGASGGAWTAYLADSADGENARQIGEGDFDDDRITIPVEGEDTEASFVVLRVTALPALDGGGDRLPYGLRVSEIDVR